MNKLKKIVAIGLTIVLTAAFSIGGTIAYLTTEKVKKTNVFEIGDIAIDLTEDTDVIGEGGTVTEDEDGAEYKNIIPGNYLKKEVKVKNTGANDAYVKVTVDVNNFDKIQALIDGIGDDDDNAEAMLDRIFDGWGLTVRDRYVDGKKDMSYKVNEITDRHILHVDSAKRIFASDVAHFSINNWFKSDAEKAAGSYTVAGAANSYYAKDMEDYSLRFTYFVFLKPREEVTLFKGLNVPAEFDKAQMAMFEGLGIDVEAQAIQAGNMGIADAYKDDAKFGEAKTAFAILAGEVKAEELEAVETITVEGTDKAAVLTAINNAEAGDVIVLAEDITIAGYNAAEKLVINKPVVIDLNGKTITTESGWGGIDAKGGCSIINGTINHTGNTAAIKAFQVDTIKDVTINLTQTAGKTKGGIVLQEGPGCYINTIENVTITGATNGIETYRCGDREDFAIGSLKNVKIDAVDTALKLSAPVGTATDCEFKGANIGADMYLYGPYSVSINMVNCKVEGATGVYAHDEAGLTNPGSLEFTYDAATTITGGITQDFETEVIDRVTIEQK